MDTETKTFSASWGWETWVATLVLVVLISAGSGLLIGIGWNLMSEAFLSGLTMVIGGALFFATIPFAYLFVPWRYDVTATELRVKRLAGDVVIPLGGIEEIQPQDVPRPRVPTTYGLFGLRGLYWKHDFGWHRAFVTRFDSLTAIYRTDGPVVVISPNDRDELIRTIGQNLPWSEPILEEAPSEHPPIRPLSPETIHKIRHG